jgi:hypothetical protein
LIFRRVELRDERHTDEDSFRTGEGQKPPKIPIGKGGFLSGVGVVDGRVHVLHIYDKAVNDSGGSVNGLCGNMEGGFAVEPPCSAAELPKGLDKIYVEEGFSTSKGNPTSGCLKIQIVNFNPIKEFLRGGGMGGFFQDFSVNAPLAV